MQKLTITKVYRWVTFFLIFLIPVGAFLEGEYVTWLAGLFFGLFLTVSDEKIEKVINVRYFFIYILLLFVFLLASWSDAVLF